MKKHYIAWWNVENLFSIKNDPDRTDKLERSLGKELNGWTKTVLNKKLKQLSSIIEKLNNGQGPDILGVCEVESAKVLGQLVENISIPERSYKVVHADSSDARGIDVAFIYDGKKYSTKKEEVFNHFILRRNATRDLLQVNFYLKPDETKILVIIGNHWPSRRGGELESEPYRIIAAETLAYWHERILEILGKDQSIIAMGDFNDEPLNRSMVQYALSQRLPRRVKSKRSRSPYLYNLMWKFMGNGLGTHFYSGDPGMLDQILVNRPLVRGDSDFELDEDSLEIVRFPEMVSKSGNPKRFGRPSSPRDFDDKGFSDHFPVAIEIIEKE